MNLRYILDGKEVVPAPDLLAWARWFETADRRVARTDLDSGVWVSTVFLGLDHSWSGDGPPIVFETMAFNAPYEGTDLDGKPRIVNCDEMDCRRYATWAEAELGHMEMVEELQAAEKRALDALAGVSRAAGAAAPTLGTGKPSRRSSGPPRRVQVRARQSRADARRRKRQSARP